ncbi:MAG: hypothetical protein EOO16_06955 [Chitinophagaceae bacterium]|nr:MAG: hypothetical protein EOO16_06955 [Chitinophagaceae bacterium]
MKKAFLRILFFLLVLAAAPAAQAQCSVCSRTTEQMGEKPAKGINNGVIYLMAMPLAIIGIIGFRWWQRNRDTISDGGGYQS